MTLATAMMCPSSFLQDLYIDLVEIEKGSDLYEPLPIQPSRRPYSDEDEEGTVLSSLEAPRQPFELAVRITSLVHAALQFACAAIETVPLLAVTTVTVLFNASNSGFFTRDGGRLERVVSAALAALASVWLPVGTSLWAVLNPSDLSDEDSLIQYQFKAQALLFLFTLPSLPRLTDGLPEGTRETLEGILPRGADEFEERTGASGKVDPLERADTEAFEWRTNLADTLVRHGRRYPPFLRDVDLSSYEFGHDLQDAVTRAAQDPSESSFFEFLDMI